MIRRLNRHRGEQAQPAPPTPSSSGSDAWALTALRAVPTAWARVDPRLQVLEYSPAAGAIFRGAPAAPLSLIAFSRSPEIENAARALFAGSSGPWQIRVTHHDATVAVSGVVLDDGTAMMFWENRTELMRLESVRTEFVANLAHELRTPVTSLRLAVETLKQGPEARDAAIFLERILDETDYLTGMLQTLSQLAHLEEGSIVMEIKPVPLGAVVEESWRRVSAQRTASVRLDVAVSVDFTVTADRAKLGEILQNLLDNAHRHSPAGGAIEVSAEYQGDEVWVSIADHGPGIPPSDLARIFERFFKSDWSRTRGDRGSGLGLAITRHLVEAHGGRIWAETREHGGSVLRFTLPADPRK